MANYNKSMVRRGWHFDDTTQELQAYQDGVEIIQYPLGSRFYVDGTNGADTNTGTSWTTAFETIQAAMDAATALASRGRVKIYVAPGGYTEDITTPLNSACPFGELIAVNPTPGRSYGAVYLYAATAATPCLTVQARGWRIKGFELEAQADAPAVVVGGTTAGNNGSGVMFEDCLFVGLQQGLCGIDIQSSIAGNPLGTVRNCGFYGFTSGSTAGTCIMCSNSGIAAPRFWLIEDCWFGDSDNLLKMNPRGFRESTIRNNIFYAGGANQSPTALFDNTGGLNNIITGNAFGGVYTIAGGYVGHASDFWVGNFAEASSGESDYGVTYAIPAT